MYKTYDELLEAVRNLGVKKINKFSEEWDDYFCDVLELLLDSKRSVYIYYDSDGSAELYTNNGMIHYPQEKETATERIMIDSGVITYYGE